jgi:hypothetical protein
MPYAVVFGEPHMKRMMPIETVADIEKLEKENESQALRHGDPAYDQPFILWRGMHNSDYDLKASLQVYLSKALGETRWRSVIEKRERSLVNQFVDHVKPYTNELHQQSHLNPPGDNETVSHLSVMQHYGWPTRFVDFTACFWTALFFAAEKADNDHDMGLYRLKCRNSNAVNEGGNKLP